MSPINIKTLKKNEQKELLNSVDTIFTDCDGVLWLGSEAVENATTTLNALKDEGKSIFYITNSSQITIEDFQKKCIKLGFNVSKEQMICPAWLTAQYLKSLDFKQKVYVIGPHEIGEELSLVGINSFGYGPDEFVPSSEDALVPIDIEIDADVGAVILAIDTYVSYNKLVKACTYLKNADCLYIASSPDKRALVKSRNLLVPGIAPFICLIERVTGRKPIVLGKPQPYAYQLINKDKNIIPNRTLMIGDTCETDIQFGNQIGMKTLLVLNGQNNLKDVENFKKLGYDKYVPDYCIDSIAGLQELLDTII